MSTVVEIKEAIAHLSPQEYPNRRSIRQTDQRSPGGELSSLRKLLIAMEERLSDRKQESTRSADGKI